jgi:hypothetical protein
MAGLDLTSRESAMKGGARGPALLPGNKDESLLYRAILRTGELKMPPGKEGLSKAEIDLLGDWIDQGAPWTPEASSSKPAGSDWWAFRTPIRPPIPAAQSSDRTRTPIDNFIAAKLRSKGLSPAPQAAKDVLIRRLYFDLHGLPPSPADAAAFVENASPDAWERLIDRLLASPQYGERWGRHWLDVVRYADTGGHENDIYLMNAWRYRDYVIDSFNEDKPYNVFVQEQLAADEVWPNDLNHEGTYLVPKPKQVDFKRRLGTGLFTVGPVLPASALNPQQFRSERLSDWADVVGAAFLGLTVGCARCHDHKFDPIPQKDYFRLQAVFAASDVCETPTVPPATVFEFRNDYPKQLVVDDLAAALERLNQSVRDRLMAATSSEADRGRFKRQGYNALAQHFTQEEKALRERLLLNLGKAYLEAPKPAPTADVLCHLEKPSEVRVEIRGEWNNRGDFVAPGILSALEGSPIDNPRFSNDSQRRRDYALWLTDPNHPLTARVMVNRVWQWHFGWGLVRTANDFGRQGDPPDNPELLDWLTTEFVANNWSLKQLHKLILLSAAWQRSTEFQAKNFEIDPENRFLWRMNSRRLEAEAVRDAILAVSGDLSVKAGGPPILIPLNEEEMAGVKGGVDRWPATSDPAAPRRRSVYLFQKRLFRIPFLEVFDLPETSMSCARRSSTNVAPQALTLLNHPFVLEQSRVFARRLQSMGSGPADWIENAWLLAYARKPTPSEIRRALELLGGSNELASKTHTEARLAELCLMLFNTNEFLYLD